jgi:hypothetical protein
MLRGAGLRASALFSFTFKNQDAMKNLMLCMLCIAAVLTASTAGYGQGGQQLEAAALRAYERGYAGNEPAAQAQAFDEAAELFELAAQAYRREGEAAKAREMDSFVQLARQNAANRRLLARQTAFEQVDLTSPGAKLAPPVSYPEGPAQSIAPAASVSPASSRYPRFKVALGIAGGPAPAPITVAGQTVADTFVSVVFSDPQVFEQLIERFGGEFVPGELTGHPLHDIKMESKVQVMPGISLGAALSPSLEASVNGYYFRSEWRGQFPVTVFPFEGETPRTESGSIYATAQGVLADVRLTYLLPGQRLRPYVEAGGRGQFAIRTTSGMELAGLELPFRLRPLTDAFSAFAGAGLRLNLGRNAYVQAGAAYAKVPGSNYAAMGEVGMGWRFSGRR